MTIAHDYTDFAHTGPDTPAGKWMRQFWQPIALASEIEIGRSKPIKIMSEDFTLYRGSDGASRVVAFRCAHRGTQLSVGTVEDNYVRCRYHGWKFDGTGQCVEAPGNPAAYADQTRIAGYPTREYLGLIFTFFGVGEPPAFPPFPAFSGNGWIETRTRLLPCNYFQSWENDFDEYHVAWTHRTGKIHTPPDPTEKVVEETDWGVLKRSRKVDGTERVTGYFMPHMVRLVIPSPNEFSYRKLGPAYRDTYIVHTPVDDESHLLLVTQEVRVEPDQVEEYHKVYDEWMNYATTDSLTEVGDQILAGKARLEDYLDYPNLVALEDYVSQVGQGRIADRSAERLSRTDSDIALLRGIFTREMTALAEGRPLKAWSTISEMPGADVTEEILANEGTGARAASV